MKHYLFEVIEEGHANEGEQFIVGAATRKQAHEIAHDNFGCTCQCYGEISEEEAEASGLDEY